MKPRNYKSSLLHCLVLFTFCPSVYAVPLTWDTVSGDGATITPGSGTWDLAATSWNDAGADVAWTQTSATVGINGAIFGGADGTYAISLDTGLAASSVTFNNGGYTLSGASPQTLSVGGFGNDRIIVAADKTATIGNNATVDFNNGGTGSNTGTRATVNSGSTLNIDAGGTLTRSIGGGIVANGGTIGFAGTGTVNVAGTLSYSGPTPTLGGGILVAGASGANITVNVNNGGLMDSGNGQALNMSISGTTGTVNLNAGGTISTKQMVNGAGTGNLNFNGGTLKAITDNATFMGGLSNVFVKSGGAVIDTNGFNVAIAQQLKTDTVSLGGGLTKNGAGDLTLSGANTFTGATTVTGGTLALKGYAINSSSSLSVTNGTVSLQGDNSIKYTGGVTLNSGGLMTMDNNWTANIGSITLNGGELSSGGFHNATYGSYYMNGNVTAGAGTSTISAVNITSGGVRSFDVASGGTLDVTGSFSSLYGSFGLTKVGSGTLTLGGSNTYNGDTTVSAGTLLVNGALAADSTVTVGGTGASGTPTLGGIGTINGSVTIAAAGGGAAGILAPGSSVGNLTFNDGLTLAGIFSWELAALSTANPGTDFDTVTVTAGNVDLTGASLSLSLGSYTPSAIPFWQTPQTWSGILNNTGTGSLTGAFASLDNSAWSSLGSFAPTYSGNDVNLVWTPVPEPSAAVLAGCLLGTALLRRRRSFSLSGSAGLPGKGFLRAKATQN